MKSKIKYNIRSKTLRKVFRYDIGDSCVGANIIIAFK